MSEAGGALIIGILLGLAVTVAKNVHESYEKLFQFNTHFFFIALLPPIIFDAGFNLDVAPFFHNIGATCLLAFVGTSISTGVVAVMMWVPGVLGASYAISFFHSCIFGAIISATDPVTVLAVFGRLRANKDLHALVFGESVLNDAVAIVLFRVISEFEGRDVTFPAVMFGVWQFTYIFVGSLLIGVGFGFLAALLFKSQYFRNEHTPVEAGLVVILAYCSFYMTDGLGLSGIVSIMFCGIVMAKYVRPNLSHTTDDRVSSFFRVIASLSEIFVFIYIGCALFTEQQAWGHGLTWSFIGFCLLALAVSRAANVYPCIAVVNLFRPEEQKIPGPVKHMMWFSGLRGAMAFALAVLAQDQLGASGDVVLTATFFMVLITVLFNGGAAARLLEYWQLKDESDHVLPRMNASILHGPDDDSGALEGVQLGVMTTEHALRPEGYTFKSGHGRFMDSIHDFQRQGGVVTKFERMDKVLGNYLIAPTESSPTIGSQDVHAMRDPVSAAQSYRAEDSPLKFGNYAHGSIEPS